MKKPAKNVSPGTAGKLLPKTLYVRWEGKGDEAYIRSDQEVDRMLEYREKIRLGVYTLTEVVDVQNSNSIYPVMPKRAVAAATKRSRRR